MRIHTSKDGSKLLWWSQTLLQLFDTLEFFTRHLSADRFCAALLDNWEKNEAQKPSSVSSSTLRKRFRRALLAYHYIEGLAEDFPETLPGWDGGALNGCPCCSDAAVADNGACGNGGEGAAGDGGGVVSGDASGGESGSGSDGGTEAVPAAAASPFLTRAAEGADGGSDGGAEAVPRPERAAGDGSADGGSDGGAEAVPRPERAAGDGGADGGSDGGAEAVPRPERAAGDGGADGGSGGDAEAGPGPERAAGDGGADGGSDGGAEAVPRPERAAGDGGADGGSDGGAEAVPRPERAAGDGGADGGSGGDAEAGPGPERAAGDGGADGGSGGDAVAGPGPERTAGDGGADGGSGGDAEAGPGPERAAGDGGADGGSGGDAEAGPGPERAAGDGGADGGSGGDAEAGPGPERAAGDGGADGGSGGDAEAGPGPERAAGDGGDGSHEGSDRHGRADAAGSSGMQRARLQALAVGVHPVPPGTHPLWGLRLTGGVEDDGVGPKQLHSVHFDANFKVNLLARAGYSRHSPQLPRRRFFISNERVLAALGEPAASRDIGPTHCSNFNADRVLASDSQKNIITALGVALCRHGMLLRLVNLFGGERHAYCTSTVQSILQAGTGIRFMWYDIACRWGRSYEKWLVEQDDRLREVRSRLQEKCEEEEQRRKRQLMPPPQGQEEQQRQVQAEQAARFVKGEYARCRLALDKLQRCDILDADTDAVSLGLLYPGADSASIRQRPVLIRSIRTRLEELESQHAINPADWVDGSEAFKAGLAELAKGEVLKLQSELEEAVADYWSLEYVIQHLSGRRKEQGYAIRDKSQTKQRIEGMWGRLVSWCKVAGAVSAALASAIKEPDALQKAMGQKFPWGVEGGPQEGKTSRLRAALLRSYHDRKRGNEEVALIVAEIEKAIKKCERRVQLLSDALSQSDDRTLPGRLRLLRLHLGRNERMLVAFRLLKEGQIPRDQSAIIDEDW
ncbi:hypothetical protein PLESTM_000862500 [Pleodorina starrii]|nr:hypothetical protein PLESTM_000862500 [Pleodorina starrii]